MPESRPQPPLPARTEHISDERAHAALRRAAELQIQALERLERQSLARNTGGPAGESAADGFRRADIETAAIEAGIAPEFIRQALLEQEIPGEQPAELAPWIDRMGSHLLRTRQRSIELSRTIDASPAAVLEAMQRIIPANPYGMVLIDSVGDPLAGGVLVFEIPKNSSMTDSFGYSATVIELFHLQATLRPVSMGEHDGCELTVRGDLRSGMKRNVRMGLTLSGMGGGFGAFVGIALSAGALLPVIAAGAALGLAGGGGATVAGYGAVYKHYLKKMIGHLETLLRVVDTSARTGGGFRPPEAPPRSDLGTVFGVLGMPE